MRFGSRRPGGMSPADFREWAKAEVLAAIKAKFDALKGDPVDGFSDADEEAAFRYQHDRVAALFAPVKKRGRIIGPRHE